jgi:hypothetical protein
VGAALGLIIGRWWATAAPIGFGIWIALSTEVDEVEPWVLGAAYALCGGIGVATGVVIRRRRTRSTEAQPL